jgi:hypothetical protein
MLPVAEAPTDSRGVEAVLDKTAAQVAAAEDARTTSQVVAEATAAVAATAARPETAAPAALSLCFT